MRQIITKKLAGKDCILRSHGSDPTDPYWLFSEASFSTSLRHRFELWREWDQSHDLEPPFVQFIGLNPSTADERVNDPTVKRCIERSKRMGYTRFLMTNLFPLRSTDPKGLDGREQEHAAENLDAIITAASAASIVICAWGSAHPAAKARGKVIVEHLTANGNGDKLHALRINKDGSPAHPLYLPYSLQPVPFPAK